RPADLDRRLIAVLKLPGDPLERRNALLDEMRAHAEPQLADHCALGAVAELVLDDSSGEGDPARHPAGLGPDPGYGPVERDLERVDARVVLRAAVWREVGAEHRPVPGPGDADRVERRPRIARPVAQPPGAPREELTLAMPPYDRWRHGRLRCRGRRDDRLRCDSTGRTLVWRRVVRRPAVLRTARRLPHHTEEQVEPIARRGRSVVALLLAHSVTTRSFSGVGSTGAGLVGGWRSAGSLAGTCSMMRTMRPRSIG